jgi:hypothetical protein
MPYGTDLHTGDTLFLELAKPVLANWTSEPNNLQVEDEVDAQLVGSCDRDTEGRDNKPT